MRIKILNNQRGVALITSLMIMSLMTIIGISALNTTDIELKIAGNEKSATQALYAAEAGIHDAIAMLKAYPTDWTDLTAGTIFSDSLGANNEKSYEFSLSDITASTVTITSTGLAGGSTKQITVTFEQNTTSLAPEAAISILDDGGSSVDEFSNGK